MKFILLSSNRYYSSRNSDGERLRVITVKLPEEVVEKMDLVCRRLGLQYRSELIRAAIDCYIKRYLEGQEY